MLRALTIPLLASACALPAATVPAEARNFIDKNCVACHRSTKAPAGIDLTALRFDPADAENYARWVRVYDAVDRGAMPPANPASVTSASRAAFTKALAAPIIEFERQRTSAQGRSVLRRLNR
jgi:uncharacterized membrane protein